MLSGKERKSWQSTFDRLAEYRKRDPGFKRAKAEWVEAEATLGHDPVDGEPGEIVDGQFRPLFPSPKRVTESEG
jgi:hypothetical protein